MPEIVYSNEFLNSPGANTAVLQPDHAAVDTYLQLAQINHARKTLAYNQAKDQADKIAASTNFDTANMMDVDVQPTIEKKVELRKFAYEHPDAVLDPSSPDAPAFNNMVKDITFRINKSKHDYALSKYWKETGVNSPLFKDNPEPLFNEVSRFDKHPDVTTREFNLPAPSIDFNPVHFLTQNKDMFAEEQTLGKPSNSGIAGVVKVPSKTQYSQASIEKGLNFAWDNSPEYSDVKKHYNQLWSENPSVQQTYKTPKDFYLASMSPIAEQLGMKSGENLQNIPKDSAYDNPTEGIRYIAENAQNLADPNSKAYKPAEGQRVEKVYYSTDGGNQRIETTKTPNSEEIKVSHDFDDTPMLISQGGQQTETAITGIFNIDGKLYARTLAKQRDDGSIDKKDLIPINDVKAQLIVPFVDKQYGSSPNTAKLAQTSLDLYDKNKTAPKSTESGIQWK